MRWRASRPVSASDDYRSSAALSAPNRRQAEELLYWPKATGTYLGRLADRSDLYATEYQLLVRKGPHQKGVQTYTITETDAPADWRLPL